MKKALLSVAMLAALIAPNYADAGKESHLSQLRRERAAARDHRSGGGPNILMKAAALFALIQASGGQLLFGGINQGTLGGRLNQRPFGGYYEPQKIERPRDPEPSTLMKCMHGSSDPVCAPQGIIETPSPAPHTPDLSTQCCVPGPKGYCTSCKR